jgi:hypothetical protein
VAKVRRQELVGPKRRRAASFGFRHLEVALQHEHHLGSPLHRRGLGVRRPQLEARHEPETTPQEQLTERERKRERERETFATPLRF